MRFRIVYNDGRQKGYLTHCKDINKFIQRLKDRGIAIFHIEYLEIDGTEKDPKILKIR